MADGNTTLEYNGVLIEGLTTREFRGEPQYIDEQVFVWRTTILVIGYVHQSHQLTTFITPQDGDGVAGMVDRIRRSLLEPRRDLVFKVGGKIAFEAKGTETFSPGVKNIDVSHGPKPKAANVTKIISTKSMRIEFRIESDTLLCETDQNTKGVLLNQFSIAEDRDENHYMTRSIDGRIRFAHVIASAGMFDNLAFPALEGGFQRDSIRTTKTRDGLHLEYTIRDKQMFVTTPPPATSFTCKHTETTIKGVQFFGTLSCKMNGPPGVNKHQMIVNAFRIAENRLQLKVQKGETPPFIIENMSVSDFVNAGDIEVTIKVRHMPQSDSAGSVLADFVKATAALIGKPLSRASGDDIDGYNNRIAVRPVAYPAGSSADAFVSFLLQTPCNDKHALPGQPPVIPGTPSPPSGGGGSPGSPGPELINMEVDLDSGDVVTPSHDISAQNEGMYTHYKIESRDAVQVNNVHASVGIEFDKAGKTTRLIQFAPNIAKRRIRVLAQRYGKEPEIPKHEAFTGSSLQPYGISKIVADAPEEQLGAGEKMFTVACEMEFAYDDAPNPGDDVRTGSLPWDESTIAENKISGSSKKSPGGSEAIG